MRIIVLGTRGFPDIPGSVEKHCEELYPRLAEMGCQVIVLGRQPYVGETVREYKKVIVGYLPCPRQGFLEVPVHTFLGMFAAKKLKADIVHIHGAGPAFFTLLARLLHMNVVMTYQGPDYEQQKGNWFTKRILKLGEWIGCRNADEVICISEQSAQDVQGKFRRLVHVIPAQPGEVSLASQNWDCIAEQTLRVYQKVISRKQTRSV